MEIRAEGINCRIYCRGSYSIATLLDWYLEQCGRKMLHGTTERYYEMDVSAHSPRPPGRNNTGQVTQHMKGSLWWDEDRDELYGEIRTSGGLSDFKQAERLDRDLWNKGSG